ncbi:MAG: Gfo/Idh/MocA family oxidoreductase [Phycisphaeraceae bacterium]|nr:Gfo/Idh/MocA family oxidoreductase [Phycisphaeraceae bacterium]
MAGHRVVIVGVGSIGERHTRCFLATRRCEVGIVEPNADLCRTVSDRYQLRHAFASFDEALTTGFTAALIATPAQLHIPMTAKAVECGLHVLIEKPLSTSLEGIAELKSLVAKMGVKVGVAYTYRAFKALRAMRNAILSGKFGKPLDIVVVAGQHFPFFRPAYREIYYKDHRTGGGGIQDGLTHLINACEWIVGPIDRLACDAEHQALDGVTVEDNVHLIARHGRVMASYTFNQYQYHNEVSITVNCERGSARFEAHSNRWKWTTQINEPWTVEEFGQLERDTLYVDQAHAFLDAIEGKGDVSCTLDEGEQTLRVNLAALRSSDEGALRTI